MSSTATNGALNIYNVPRYTTSINAVLKSHFNSDGLDLIQVVNEGGKVIWNLSATGVATFNPANPSKKFGIPQASLHQYFGNTFAQAFTNSSNLDIFQVHNGSKVMFHVDYQGNAFTP